MSILKCLYTSKAQNFLMGIIGLCLQGILLALTGMGAGGLEDPAINSNALTAMYASIAVTGAIGSGAIINVLGFRSSFFVASIVFLLYMLALWSYHSINSAVLVTASGIVLGIGASLLYAAQGCIMMSYPLEHEKGYYISVFWIITNLGAVFGSMCSFILNFSNETRELSSDTYLIFVGFILCGMVLSFFVCSVDKIIRSDGTKIRKLNKLRLKDHLSIFKRVYTNTMLLSLLPLFLASNFYYTYQFNTFNATLFNVRTRSLNTSLYWLIEVLAAPLWGKLLDLGRLSIKKRGLSSTTLLALLLIVTWVSNYVIQYWLTSDGLLDFTDKNYFPYLCVFLGFGLSDVGYQLTLMWMVGQLSEDPQIVGSYFGFLNSTQAAGAAVAWKLNANGYDPRYEMMTNVILLVLALLSLGGVAMRLPFPSSSTPRVSNAVEDSEFKHEV